jgi:hypothetical protein
MYFINNQFYIYLTLNIKTTNYKSVKQHKLNDCKRIMLNKKL